MKAVQNDSVRHGGLFDGSAVTTYSEAYDDVNGEQHTKAMLEKWNATASENTYPRQDAAYLCSQYEDEGVGAKGSWYMGSFGEWVRIFDACAEKSGLTAAVANDAQANAIVPVTTYDASDADFATGRYYITETTDNNRLLMPKDGNVYPNAGINNWIQITAKRFAPTSHNLDYDFLATECTYWTSTQSAGYYTYVYRMQFKQQCLNFYNSGDKARVENDWNGGEACHVRPILKF